jgi:putative FmdB family regulatory protein
MPSYPYRCITCQHPFEIVKRVAEIDNPESCPECGNPADRYISRTHFYGAGDWDKAEWNPGLGCVTKGARHRKEMARQRGMEEVGNDYRSPDTLHVEKERSREEKRERAWAEV